MAWNMTSSWARIDWLLFVLIASHALSWLVLSTYLEPPLPKEEFVHIFKFYL